MKQKELKNLAKKIAKLELIIQNSTDDDEIWECEQDIMYLTGKVTSFDEIDTLDEMIQEIIREQS